MCRGLHARKLTEQLYFEYLSYTLNNYRNQVDFNDYTRTLLVPTDIHAGVPYFTIAPCITLSFPFSAEPTIFLGEASLELSSKCNMQGFCYSLLIVFLAAQLSCLPFKEGRKKEGEEPDHKLRPC